jgi:hypothetical protein
MPSGVQRGVNSEFGEQNSQPSQGSGQNRCGERRVNHVCHHALVADGQIGTKRMDGITAEVSDAGLDLRGHGKIHGVTVAKGLLYAEDRTVGYKADRRVA